MPTCSTCGADAASTDTFCQACGAALNAAAPTSTMMPPPAPTLHRSSGHPVGGDGAAAGGHRGVAGNGAGRRAEELVGRSQPNQTYLGNRLIYGDGESFDPLTGAFVKQMLLEGFIVWFVSIALALVPTALIIAGYSNGNGGLRTIGGIGIFLAGPPLWLYYWFHRIPVVKSEWKFLVDDQAGVAPEVFGHITWALKRREVPIKKLRVRRLSQPGGTERDYLELRDGIFTGFISAYAYGTDLYIGWTMWWRLSPFRWVIAFLGRLYLTLTGRGSQLHVIHRYEQAKAMREAMHSAAREGVDAVAGFVAYQSAGTIGSDIEVDVVAPIENVPRFVAASTE